MYITSPDAEVIKIRDRKGFVRLAVEHGAPLLPVYHFGNSQLMRWGPRSLERLARKWRVSIGWMRGRFGLPMPHRVPLFMAVGTPIPVPHLAPTDDRFASTVDALHVRLTEEIEALYHRHKGAYGWHTRPIVLQ